jgi:hypothetical protein
MLFDNDYVIDPALSNSDLYAFENDLRGFYHYKIIGDVKPDFSSKAMDIGNIVDAKILAEEELKNYYVVTDMKATGKIKEIIDTYVEFQLGIIEKAKANPKLDQSVSIAPLPWPTDIPVLKKKTDKLVDNLDFCSKYQNFMNVMEPIITKLEYQTNWSMETRMLKVMNLGGAYYQQALDCGDRVMIHINEWNKAHAKVDALQEDESTKVLFDEIFKQNNDIKVHKQVTLYGTYGKTKLKGKLDLFIEFVKDKRIRPLDLKTAGSHARFLQNYRQKKYNRQGAFYSNLLRQNFPDYIIDPFQFLVIPIETDERPEIYEMDATEMFVAEHGYTYESGYRVKGWRELVTEVEWHKANGKWDHRKDYYQKGKNIIDSKVILDADLLQLEEKAPLI